MSRFRVSRSVALAALVAAAGVPAATVAAAPAAAATSYTVTDLGSLGYGVTDALARSSPQADGPTCFRSW